MHSASTLRSTVLDDPAIRRLGTVVRQTPSRGRQVPLRQVNPFALFGSPPRQSMRDIRRVFTCAKRRMRKEVLHALRLTGKGAGARFRLRNENSSERC